MAGLLGWWRPFVRTAAQSLRGCGQSPTRRALGYRSINRASRTHPRFSGENFDRNMAAASALRTLASEKSATPAQVALAWLLHKGDDIVPIPGTKRRPYLEENLGAAEVRLSAAEMELLDSALAPEAVAGPRYNERLMKFIDR